MEVKMAKKIYLFCLVLLLSACVTNTNLKDMPKEQRELITTRTYNHDYIKVFKAVITVLSDRGYIIQNSDKELGMITTEFKNDYSVIWGNYRIKIQAQIDKVNTTSTKVKLTPNAEVLGLMGVGYEKVEFTDKSSKSFSELFDKIQQELEG